jgi:hypothetical protein
MPFSILFRNHSLLKQPEPIPPGRLSPLEALLILAGALWLLALLGFPISHNDTWWHLKCGQWLIEHRAFPARDVFSYSSPDTTWLKRSWLFGLLAWPIYAMAGPAGLISAKMLVALASAGLCLAFSVKRGASLALAALFTALAMIASRFSWTERPQSVSHLLFVVLLFILEIPEGRWRWLALFALGVAWSNLNGSAVILPAFVLAYETGAFFKGRQIRLKALAACLAGTLINPQGGYEYGQVAGLFGGESAMRTMLAEWQPPALAGSPALLILVACLLPLTVMAWRSGKWGAALLLLAAAAPGLKFDRMTPFFCLAIAAWGPCLLRKAWQPRRLLEAALAALLVMAMLGHGSWMLTRERLFNSLVNRSRFPIAGCDFLAKERPIGRLGNLYADGAYLLFRLGPETKVFVDSRQMNYPMQVFDDAIVLEGALPAWPQVAKRYGFSCMVLPLRSLLSPKFLAEPSWRLVYFDDDYLIFATKEEWQAHAGRWPWYQGVDPLKATLAPSAPLEGSIKALAARLASQAPDAKGYYLLGLAYARAGKTWDAEQSLMASLALDPSQEAARETLINLANLKPKK